MELPYVVTYKRPHFFKLESKMQGLTIIQAFDGQTAWQATPATDNKPQAMLPSHANSLRNQGKFDGPLIGYEDDGYNLELIGQEEIEGQNTYHLKLTQADDSLRAANGDFITHVYVDTASFLEMKITIQGDIEGNRFEVDLYPSDYKEIDGVKIAHTITTKMGSKVMAKQVFNKIELNIDIPDSEFMMPN